MLLLLLLLPLLIHEAKTFDFPPRIHLRVGFVPDAPFVMYDENGGTSSKYSGLLYDFLHRLPIFAAADGVELEFEIGETPHTFTGAFDMVSNDCNSTSLNQDEFGCDELDLVVATTVANPSRVMRAHLSPSILKAAISTMKYVPALEDEDSSGGPLADVTTLTQATTANATVCVKDGSYTAFIFPKEFPLLNYHLCQNGIDGCVEDLKAQVCALFVAPQYELMYKAAWDEDSQGKLQVTGEQYLAQFVSWPMREDLPLLVRRGVDRWILQAIANATMDELFSHYFQKALCPIGTSGTNCELFCDPDHGQSNNQGICVCHSTKWTGEDCSIEVPEDKNAIPETFQNIAICLMTINGVVIVGCAIWLYYFRNTAQVRYSQPFFLLLVLFGCLVSSSTIAALMQQDHNTTPKCMAGVWLYSVGFAITFGTLMAKVLRVYMLFATGTRDKRTRTNTDSPRFSFVSFQDTLLVIGMVLSIDIAILLAWQFTDPLAWTRTIIRADQFGEPLESEGYCTCDSWKLFGGLIASFHIILMATACYLSYLSREIPSRFSVSRMVSIAMVSNFQIFVVGVPVLVLLGTDPQASFLLRSLMIFVNDLGVVLLIFGNLVYSLHFADKASQSAASVKEELGVAVRRFSAATTSSPSVRNRSNNGYSPSAYAKSLQRKTAHPDKLKEHEDESQYSDDDQHPVPQPPQMLSDSPNSPATSAEEQSQTAYPVIGVPRNLEEHTSSVTLGQFEEAEAGPEETSPWHRATLPFHRFFTGQVQSAPKAVNRPVSESSKTPNSATREPTHVVINAHVAPTRSNLMSSITLGDLAEEDGEGSTQPELDGKPLNRTGPRYPLSRFFTGPAQAAPRALQRPVSEISSGLNSSTRGFSPGSSHGPVMPRRQASELEDSREFSVPKGLIMPLRKVSEVEYLQPPSKAAGLTMPQRTISEVVVDNEEQEALSPTQDHLSSVEEDGESEWNTPGSRRHSNVRQSEGAPQMPPRRPSL
ncbi:acid type B receptor subunit 2 [Seminavis robusta]|uniref:Acid type B receptor subunit 2 n=1 Tax=Seminavis robusta TaxID=568900 RepID=A0A9N8DMR3_9STRA|nr:acid type B receptor subunit 2 [Seminavis robusta]|eukprot:Sro164_g073540.1 acid type B receptor subunit 2 (989) ;mRNA; f:25314-28367